MKSLVLIYKPLVLGLVDKILMKCFSVAIGPCDISSPNKSENSKISNRRLSSSAEKLYSTKEFWTTKMSSVVSQFRSSVE